MPTFAYGKVILLGEHSVVYGHPALAGALADGVRVEITSGSGRLHVPAWGLSTDAQKSEPTVARAYRAIRERLGVGDKSAVDFTVSFAVPTGAGLGSSAAMAVALARAIAEAHGIRATEQDLAGAAMASETEVHGKPSGLDHTVALQGGFGLYTRSGGLKPVRAAQPVTLVIGHTGRERDTRGRVSRVAELVEERTRETHEHFFAIANIVERGRSAVERGQASELGQAMDENQQHLEALEVSCPRSSGCARSPATRERRAPS